MKILTAILGSIFVLFVSVAAMENSPLDQSGTSIQAAQHQHDAGTGCCDKAGGMCARNGKTDGKCCKQEECCKDDCCKDGKCDKDCKCECCKSGGCCSKTEGQKTDGATHKGDCCKKATSKKPALVASH